jgi:hypothetical protein
MGEESAEIIRDGEAARSAERVCRERTREHAGRRGACSGSRLGVNCIQSELRRLQMELSEFPAVTLLEGSYELR